MYEKKPQPQAHKCTKPQTVFFIRLAWTHMAHSVESHIVLHIWCLPAHIPMRMNITVCVFILFHMFAVVDPVCVSFTFIYAINSIWANMFKMHTLSLNSIKYTTVLFCNPRQPILFKEHFIGAMVFVCDVECRVSYMLGLGHR